MDTKIMDFQGSHFNVFLMTLTFYFLLDISMNIFYD